MERRIGLMRVSPARLKLKFAEKREEELRDEIKTLNKEIESLKQEEKRVPLF